MSGMVEEKPILLPGGVADPAGRLGFLESPGGGIDAVDLATGETLWQTREASLPLLATGNELMAAAPAGLGEMRIAVFAARESGRRRLVSASLGSFPSWSFTAVRRQGNELLLAWESQPSEQHHGGQALPDEQTPEPAQAKEARMDLRSGRVEGLPAGFHRDSSGSHLLAGLGDAGAAVPLGAHWVWGPKQEETVASKFFALSGIPNGTRTRVAALKVSMSCPQGCLPVC
jgi:hypothetical protein